MYPKYERYSPAWLARMNKMLAIGAAYFADKGNYNMADKCLTRIGNHQKMLTASK